MTRDIFWAGVIGFMFAVWMFASPWSDSTKYKKAIKECEKTLPRDQHCKVVGVPE
jgi:hypothetical protein